MTDKKIADLHQDTPHATFTAKCVPHDCDLRIDKDGPYCPKCREEDKKK